MKRTGLIIGLIFLVFTVAGCVSTTNVNDAPYYRGKKANEKGDYKAAIEDFNTAIKTSNRFREFAYEKLGDAYFKIGNYRDAITAYKKYLHSTYYNSAFDAGLPKDKVKLYDESPSYRGTAAIKIRSSYQALKDLDSAVLYMEQLIAKDQSNSYYFRELGYIYMMIGQYDKAITATKRAIELNPQDPYAYDNLGYVYGKKKQYDKAFKAFRKSIEINPKNDVAYYNYGQFLAEKSDYAEAAEQYKKAVSLRPNNRTYLSGLTDAYYKQGKYDEALDVVNINLSTFTGIGVEIEIDDVYTVKYPVIKGTSESGSAKKAGLLIRDRIIKIDGEETKDFTIAKVVQGLRGEEGTPIVLTIIRQDTKKPLEKTVTRERKITAAASTGTGYRSIILRQMGKQEEALKDAKQAYSLNSSDQWAQFALGASFLDQGRYDEAVKLLSQVKGSTSARILEATAYAKKSDFKKAIDMYSAIPEEKLSPKNVPLWDDRTVLLKTLNPFISPKMESAGRLKTQGKYKEALKELGEAMKVADDKTSKEICGAIYRIMNLDPRLSVLPEEARKYALRGDVLTEEGKFGEAVKEYRKAVQAAPYIAKLYFNTAMIYGELKRHPQAIRHMKTYLNLAPEAPNARAAKDQIYKWEFKMEKGK